MIDDTNFTKDVRVRFCPSPTGWMHIGSMRNILFNYLWAKKCNGKFILRVEDTDVERKVEGGIESIYENFAAYGIEIDEGPQVGGDYGPYVQSERLDIYKKYSEELLQKGSAYHCFCSEDRLKELRENQIKNKQQPMYDGKCRDLSPDDVQKKIKAGEKYVIRLKVPRTGFTEYEDVNHGKVRVKNELIDDQILLKSDEYPTYVFAVVVDDYLMKISHLIRGEEYVSSTPKTILIYEAFGWKMPYLIQPPNVLNPDGRKKLSKRGGSNAALKFLRKGYLLEALWNFLALLGWSPSDKDGNPDEIYSMDELVKLFDLRRIRKSGSRFLPDKLDHFNGHYIREMDDSELADRIFEWIDNIVLHDFVSDKYLELLDWEKKLIEDTKKYHPLWKGKREYFEKILPLVKERLHYLAELPELLSFFYDEKLEYSKDDFKKFSNAKDNLKTLWAELKPVLEKSWEHETWENTIRVYADKAGWKHGDMFMLLRVAVTGRTASPPLFECMEILGLEKCDSFVNDCIKFLE
ncbi:glutamate--tRNA ligase [Candidatus Dojkabacteria bacterium]|nr:glutamate--tRNA ligase [Candidatus Dojkabacteria bacterium]